MRRSRLDLPTLGKPEQGRVRDQLEVRLERALLAVDADLRPGAAPGAWPWRSAVAALPGPPRATTPARRRARGRPAASPSSSTCVPTGTATTSSAPRGPARWGPLAVRARGGAGCAAIAQRGEVAQVGVGAQHDVTAAAAVAAGRATARDVLLAPERDAAVAAAPASDDGSVARSGNTSAA